ncbi:MAG: glycosyltransferase, partial [Acidobacteriota bacterium]
MRIGVIAPEFPPMLGGMAELARGLVTALAATDQVRVHTLPGHGVAGGVEGPWMDGVPVRGRPAVDAATLPRGETDVWLLLNAGLAPLARHLDAPTFCYLHGNDFTNPWLACGPRWFEALRRPYAARLRHALRRRSIRRQLPVVRHLLTNSHQTAALIRDRLRVGSERISVVHPGVHDDFFQDGEPAATTTDEPAPLRVLTVTRLTRHTRRKNVEGVLRAVASLTHGAEPIPIH